MADENRSLFGAIGRIFKFWKWKWVVRLWDKGDQMYTSDAAGVRAGFEVAKEGQIKTFQELLDAVTLQETIVAGKEDKLKNLQTEEDTLIRRRNGALNEGQKAKAAGDTAALETHRAAFKRFDNRIKEIDAEQERLNGELTDIKAKLVGYSSRLTEMQASIQKLDQEQAETIADMEASKAQIEVEKRLGGLMSRMDSGPVDAIRKKRQELAAQARVLSKVNKSDVRVQDAAYDKAATDAQSDDLFDKMIAANEAEKAARGKDTQTPEADKKGTDNVPF
jgi:chromosome segregation ATPase